MGYVEVEEVGRGKALVRFTELPQALHGTDPHWAPPVVAWERYRLDTRRNPYFDRGDATYLLARKRGRPVGRIAAHLPEGGADGRFGFWTTIDDGEVAARLVAAARSWLEERGCRSMTGPWSFEPSDEPGVLVEGHDEPGTTGRPWHPPWEGRLLQELAPSSVEDTAWWRLPATDHGGVRPLDEDLPGQAGSYADRRLVLVGIAAVPDLSAALRSTSVRAAWGLARRAREADWDTCTVVRCTEHPSVAVPALCAAAGRAGYREVMAPWSPDGGPPLAVHRTYCFEW